jgi:precorrin-2 dehydrogenase / sirohydrochlorin ferrochelatase
MNTLFPIFLKGDLLQFLIVGGGNVGLEKVEALLKNSPHAHILVVAPLIKAEICELAKKHDITIIKESYSDIYLKDINIAIVGTDQPEVNQQVRKDCKERNILVNVADTPHLCDFYLGSVVVKDDLKIAISTNGKSPTFAKRFREILEEILPNNLQQTLENLQSIRNQLKGDFLYKVNKLNEITEVMKNKKLNK